MRGRRGLGIAVACGLSLTACAKHSPPPAPPPPPVALTTLREGPNSLRSSNTVSATATVQSINRQTRMVTLRRSDGELIRFNVGDDVTNLPQVRKGDLVNVTYYESVALHLRKPGHGHMGVTVDEDAARAQPGELPAGAVGREVKVTSKVVHVDRRNRSVTLELPGGEHITFAIEDPSQLRRLKVGDLVQATYREAIAVAVNKP
jgi:Cu/Ag efflux protein CusF